MGDSPFSADALAQSVHATLDEAFVAIPDGHSHAVIVDATLKPRTGLSAKALYAQRLEDGWNIVLEGAYDSPHGWAGQAAVMKSW